MAEFTPAVEIVLAHEGGLTNAAVASVDSGGITNFGISLKLLQRTNPKASADELEESIRSLTRDQAIEIYRKLFWLDVYAQITEQSVANKIFDMAVNMGTEAAHSIVKASLNFKNSTGFIGGPTVTAINNMAPSLRDGATFVAGDLSTSA